MMVCRYYMITYGLIVPTLAIIIFLVTAKFNFWIRVSAISIFMITAFFLFYFLVKNFDEPVEGSRVITREEVNSWGHR